jgi:feruloyl-CoA synthase
VQDCVVTGHDRDEVGALIFPNAEACKALDTQALRQFFQQLLEKLAREATGSSNRVTRLMLLQDPPSLDSGEITDKGSINQRAVLQRRARLVEALYAEPPDPRTLLVSP